MEKQTNRQIDTQRIQLDKQTAVDKYINKEFNRKVYWVKIS